MSQENVELVNRAYDALNRRDLDAFLVLMDPEVVAIPRVLAVEGGPLSGHDGIRTWWESILSVFPDFQATVLEVRGVGDATIASLRVLGRGGGSDAPFEDAIWQVTKWRDGRAVWWKAFLDRAQALEAAGLKE
jgi:ketosteroid isomerase-like protein